MLRLGGLSLLLCAASLCAQTVCPATPVYSICDVTFDLPAGPHDGLELNAEFRGPSHRTFLLRAFPLAPNRMVVRFSPSEAGQWDVRISSTLDGFHNKELRFTATPSASEGWIEAANVHHFRYTGGERRAHLWLGETVPEGLDSAGFATWAGARIAAGVTHVRLRMPDHMDEAAFAALDSRLDLLNGKGIIGDLVLTPPADGTTREARQSFFRYVLARYAARNVTWVLLERFENVERARDLLTEIAGYLNEDPFHHLRSVGAAVTSGTFADEKWTNVRRYGSPDWGIAAIENQIYNNPAVSEVRASDSDAFRHQLWNVSMTGSYLEAAVTDPAMVKALGVWKQVFGETRYWDQEPFFDAEGLRGLALPDTEYVVYVEKPGPVTVHLERKHKWNGEWINPINGQKTDIADFKEDTFAGTPPDATHDWVLHLFREGHKESLKSYRFEAHSLQLQEIEVDPAKVPYEIAKPAPEPLKMGGTVPYATHLKRETRASKSMLYLWTGEVTADNEGYRVLGTGSEGTLRIPPNIVRHFPATLHVRVYGLNALGKLYSVDQNYTVTQ